MVVRALVSINEGDALCSAFRDRLMWPRAVDAELRRAAGSVAGLTEFLRNACAEVIDLTDEEVQDAKDLQLESLTREDIERAPTKNLGEAECVVLCRRIDGVLVCHDETGRAWARRPAEEIRLGTIVDVLYVFCRVGLMKPGRAWRAYERACAAGMFVWPGMNLTPTDKARFMRNAEMLWGVGLAERTASDAAARPS